MGNYRISNADCVYLETSRICIRKAWELGMKSKNMTVGQQKEFVRKIMSVDLNWLQIMEQMKYRSHSETTYNNNVLRIYQLLLMHHKSEVSLINKDDNCVPGISPKYTEPLPSSQMTKQPELKATLYYLTARENQRMKFLNILDKDWRLIVAELNTALVDIKALRRRLREAKNEATVMRDSQLLKANEATRFEEAKSAFKVVQTENQKFKEEIKSRDEELLKLKERVASAEEISRQLQHHLSTSKDEMHQQNQLLDTAISENAQLCEEKKQLINENDHLKTEIEQLNKKLDQQTKLISEQRNDSVKAQEKITTEGSDNDDSPSGYPTGIFLEEVDDKFLCARCRRILKNPIQSFCGHRFCKDCFDRLIREDGDQAICHRCSEECEDAAENTLEQSKTFPDNAIRRELNSKLANCVFEKCKWSGSFKDYEEHFEKCDWSPRRCDTCGIKITKNQLDGHDCRPSTLDGGQECKYQCGKPVTGLDFALHLKQLLPEHFEALFRRIEKVTLLVSSNSLPSVRQGTSSDWMTTIENLVKSVEDKMQKQLENSATKETVESGRTASGAKGRAAGVAIGELSANDVIQKLAKLSADMKTCESLLTSLDREVEHDFRVIETIQENGATLRLNLERLAQTVKSMDRVLSLKNVSLADVDKRVRDLELTSYDGALLWPLTEFQSKRQEAIAGRTTSIYSPPFYTSKTGYKMCARLYLNGDGMGRGSHVSLFFVIMRGQYDALLKWPFRQKVTLMFLDQSGKNQHVMDAFRPDPNSSSFRRPTSEMNIASGCPLFMSLVQLDSPLHVFVKDDTAYIKIVISREEIQS